eukprot:4110311-Prymnesium_polylepis.2
MAPVLVGLSSMLLAKVQGPPSLGGLLSSPQRGTHHRCHILTADASELRFVDIARHCLADRAACDVWSRGEPQRVKPRGRRDRPVRIERH